MTMILNNCRRKLFEPTRNLLLSSWQKRKKEIRKDAEGFHGDYQWAVNNEYKFLMMLHKL
jgi:hypothetical protein